MRRQGARLVDKETLSNGHRSHVLTLKTFPLIGIVADSAVKDTEMAADPEEFSLTVGAPCPPKFKTSGSRTISGYPLSL